MRDFTTLLSLLKSNASYITLNIFQERVRRLDLSTITTHQWRFLLSKSSLSSAKTQKEINLLESKLKILVREIDTLLPLIKHIMTEANHSERLNCVITVKLPEPETHYQYEDRLQFLLALTLKMASGRFECNEQRYNFYKFLCVNGVRIRLTADKAQYLMPSQVERDPSLQKFLQLVNVLDQFMMTYILCLSKKHNELLNSIPDLSFTQAEQHWILLYGIFNKDLVLFEQTLAASYWAPSLKIQSSLYQQFIPTTKPLEITYENSTSNPFDIGIDATKLIQELNLR